MPKNVHRIDKTKNCVEYEFHMVSLVSVPVNATNFHTCIQLIDFLYEIIMILKFTYTDTANVSSNVKC